MYSIFDDYTIEISAALLLEAKYALSNDPVIFLLVNLFSDAKSVLRC